MTSDIQPGDLVFSHGRGIIDWTIRAAEWVRFRRGSKYNHVGMIGWQLKDGDWVVLEAESQGMTNATLTSLTSKGEVLITSPPPEVKRLRAIDFMNLQFGDRYGFITIVSVAISIILPGSIRLFRPGTWICSAVVAEALRFGGWYCRWDDIYGVTPAQLYEAVAD